MKIALFLWCWEMNMKVTNELPHDKTNNVAVHPVKTQISLSIRPVWSESALSTWRKLWSLATHWAQRRLWLDWANAQADLSLRCAHSHFVGFVMKRLKLLVTVTCGNHDKASLTNESIIQIMEAISSTSFTFQLIPKNEFIIKDLCSKMLQHGNGKSFRITAKVK